MGRTLSTDPTDRMGVYKHLDDVPADHRFERYADRHDGSDVWSTFLEEQLFDVYETERSREKARRAGRRWKAHVQERGRHHALARPVDVETWCRQLCDTATLATVYNNYWVCLERFYTWLQTHADHPHRYHPVLMAAATHDTAADVWATKIGRGASK